MQQLKRLSLNINSTAKPIFTKKKEEIKQNLIQENIQQQQQEIPIEKQQEKQEIGYFQRRPLKIIEEIKQEKTGNKHIKELVESKFLNFDIDGKNFIISKKKLLECFEKKLIEQQLKDYKQLLETNETFIFSEEHEKKDDDSNYDEEFNESYIKGYKINDNSVKKNNRIEKLVKFLKKKKIFKCTNLFLIIMKILFENYTNIEETDDIEKKLFDPIEKVKNNKIYLKGINDKAFEFLIDIVNNKKINFNMKNYKVIDVNKYKETFQKLLIVDYKKKLFLFSTLEKNKKIVSNSFKLLKEMIMIKLIKKKISNPFDLNYQYKNEYLIKFNDFIKTKKKNKKTLIENDENEENKVIEEKDHNHILIYFISFIFVLNDNPIEKSKKEIIKKCFEISIIKQKFINSKNFIKEKKIKKYKMKDFFSIEEKKSNFNYQILNSLKKCFSIEKKIDELTLSMNGLSSLPKEIEEIKMILSKNDTKSKNLLNFFDKKKMKNEKIDVIEEKKTYEMQSKNTITYTTDSSKNDVIFVRIKNSKKRKIRNILSKKDLSLNEFNNIMIIYFFKNKELNNESGLLLDNLKDLKIKISESLKLKIVIGYDFIKDELIKQ